MEEIAWYWLSRYGSALFLATPFEAQDRLPLIALDDVAALAATALARPGEFVGKTIDVAGDVSSPGDIAALLTAELRQPVAYSQVQVEGVFMYPSASSATGDIELAAGRLSAAAYAAVVARGWRRARPLSPCRRRGRVARPAQSGGK